MFLKRPWLLRDIVNGAIEWPTVIFTFDAETGHLLRPPQVMKAFYEPNGGEGDVMGVSRTRCVKFDPRDLPRGMVALTQPEVEKCFVISETEKIPLIEAAFRVKGEGDFSQVVLKKFKGTGEGQRAWYPGCDTDQVPAEVAPTRQVSKEQRRVAQAAVAAPPRAV